MLMLLCYCYPCTLSYRILFYQPEQYSRVSRYPRTIIYWSYDDWPGMDHVIHSVTSYYPTQAVAGIFSASASIIAVSVGPITTGE